ncbi:type II toxin-antitoxin system VapC family toxin [Halorussus salilacus]|uniref:type II toxin-antitoxin system VapC family toxin n=1 Tax=Halorussus salilacus TaxID=2953750 RepID=UPI0020A101DF|nr:type II toxin-antitoxin system VapC family toxin [Halorussus salilacus]USZ67556.1 type II toxin-antitoxin system VapC family toxin [Halorussus salilacus]
MLLDTSFLTDLMRGDENAVARADELEENPVRQCLSAMTLFELYYGVARSKQPDEERETVEEVLTTKPVQPADSAVMQKAGRISGELENDGEALGDGDVIIGATAAIVDEPVLTRNVSDFERIAGVEVATY